MSTVTLSQTELNRALTDATYARSLIRAGQLDDKSKNTLISKYGMEQITQWESVDSTEYELDDDAKAESYEDGKEIGKEATDGYQKNSTKSTVIAAGSFLAAAATVVSFCKTSFGSVMNWVAAGMCAAVAVLYKLLNPNKDGVDAANALKPVLEGSQAELIGAQSQMEKDGEDIEDLTKEAEEKNEEANETIADEKVKFDMYKTQYDTLLMKQNSGKALEPHEKALMQKLAPLMSEKGDIITATQEDTSEEVNGIYENIEEFQESFDYTAETMEEAHGVTDYGASFDEGVKNNINLTKAALYLNAAASTATGIKLTMDGNIFTKSISAIFAGIAFTAATALNALGISEQSKYHSDVKEEIAMRKDTEEINTETNDIYDGQLDNYVGSMEDIEELELEVPEDIEAPTDTGANTSLLSVAMNNTNGTGSANSANSTTGANNTASGTGNNITGNSMAFGTTATGGTTIAFGGITTAANTQTNGITQTNGANQTSANEKTDEKDKKDEQDV